MLRIELKERRWKTDKMQQNFFYSVRSPHTSLLFQGEPPFAKHVFWMIVGRRKQAFHHDAFINCPGKTGEFLTVHGLAVILIQSAFKPGRLGRTGWDMNENFIRRLADLIADEDTPGKIPQRFYKSGKTFFLDIESPG